MSKIRLIWWSDCLQVGSIVVENNDHLETKVMLAREDHRRLHPHCSKPVSILDLRFVLMGAVPTEVAYKITNILETPQKE